MNIGIIGSGPSGMISAFLLTNAGLKVTLFEKGTKFKQEQIKPFSPQEMDMKYENKGLTVAIGNPNVAYVEGSCFGGGSEVNSGLYHRTPKTIFDCWNTNSFSYDTLLDHMVECEELVNVCKMPFKAPISSRILKVGADKLGWACEEVPRWYKYKSRSFRGVHSGVRQSMTEAIYPKIKKDLLTLKLGIKVDRINNNKTKIDVHYTEYKTKKIEHFDYLFICAGAIATPFLLKRSRFRNKNIGKNLRLHPSIKVTAEFDSKINSPDDGVSVHQVKEFFPKYSFGSSISNLPYMGTGLLDNDIKYNKLISSWEYMSTYYAMVSEGKGSVLTIPFMEKPVVLYNIGNRGLVNLTQALINLGKLLFQAGAKTLYPSIKNAKPVKNIETLSKLARDAPRENLNLMTVHLLGTCKMSNDNTGVVDEFGRLNEDKRIIINDASIIPSQLGVNPQGTVMALAHLITSRFIEETI